VSPYVHAKDLPRGGLGLLGAIYHLYAAGLATAAREDLGLDGYGSTELLRRLPRLLRRLGDDAFERLDAVFPQQFLTLILVEIQALDSREARYDGENYTGSRSPTMIPWSSLIGGGMYGRSFAATEGRRVRRKPIRS
jgi:hypothetical protein